MIRKLQRRFILIAMAAVIIVLTSIMMCINAVNYKKAIVYADMVLQALADSGGCFDDVENENPVNTDKPPKGEEMTTETPFETRYFTVTYKADGTVTSNTVNVASVSDATALKIADMVLAGSKTKGYKGIYRYLVNKSGDGSVMVLFMDCSRQLATMKEFVQASLIISLGGIFAVFVIVVLLSKKAMEPIAESYEKQKRFITDASHELKTPITIISANNELIEMDYGESDCTRSITKQISRIAHMTKNLSMLAKIDENEVMQDISRFNISDAVADVAEPYVKMAEAQGKKLECSVEEKVEYSGDEKLIRQMTSLLLDNALKYGKSEIKLTVSSVKKKNVHIVLRNDAENVENGNLERYFGRFYRSDETRASGIEGSGIGLSIVKEIVTLHKGKITATGINNNFIINIFL